MKYDFVILFEQRSRELENVCLIKAELERRGFSVWLSSAWFWRSFKTFSRIKADYLIVPWLYDEINLGFCGAFKKGRPKAVINLQMEQVHTISTAESGTRFPKGQAKRFYHLCWGERILKRLHEMAGIPAHLLLKTGAISTDFDRAAFREGDMDKQQLGKKYGLDSAATWMLFISHLDAKSLPEYEIERVTKFRPYFRSLISEFEIIRKAIFGWFDRFLTENPSTVLIYRPHPSELRSLEVDEMATRHPNFRVIYDASVRTWIFACDVLHTMYSTSIIDAYFSGKNCGILRPAPVKREIELELFADANFIQDYETFAAFCKNPADFEFPVAEKTIREYYEFDETPAYKKICDELQRLYEEDTVVMLNEFEPLEYRYRDKLRYRLFIRLAIFLANFIRFECRPEGKYKSWLSLLSKETFGIRKEIRNLEARMRCLVEKLAE